MRCPHAFSKLYHTLPPYPPAMGFLLRSSRTGILLELPDVQEHVKYPEFPKVGRQAEDRVYEPNGPVPLILTGRPFHIRSVGEVKEDKRALHVVKLTQEELVREPIRILIEDSVPSRRRPRRKCLLASPRALSISFPDWSDARVPGDATSGMCAFASRSKGCFSVVIPSASQTGPRRGQNVSSDRFSSCGTTSSFFSACSSLYSWKSSVRRGERHSTATSRPTAPLRRRAARSSSSFRFTAI